MKIYWIGNKSEFRISPKNDSLNQSFVLLQRVAPVSSETVFSNVRDGRKKELTLEDVQTTTLPLFLVIIRWMVK